MIRIIHKWHFFFIGVIIIQMLIYNYPYMLKIEPRTIHAWRQFDCLSFAQHYYNNSATILEPRINNLGIKGNGKTASEFPIVPWLIGNTWKLTGINSSLYKLTNVIFLFFGLFFIYRVFLLEIKDKIISTLLAALVFTSPILSYYGVSTISDIQAFALSMAGFYFFYNWIRDRRVVFFILFLFLFSLAGLIKASSAMVYLVCITYFILNRYFKKDNLAHQHFYSLLALQLIPILVWYAWYTHVKHYNESNNGGFFLVGLLPYWETTSQWVKEMLPKFVFSLLPQVFSTFVFCSILILSFAGIILGPKQNKIEKFIILFCFLLLIAFVILFFGALDGHDYYFINPLGVIVVMFFITIKIFHGKWPDISKKKIIVLLSVIIPIFSYVSGIKTWKKINYNVDNWENRMVFNGFEQKGYFWNYWHDRRRYQVLEDKMLDLEKGGVAKRDTVFCMGDGTINRALYLLKKEGYSDFNAGPENAPEFVNSHPNIKYVVLIDSTLKTKYYLKPLFRNKVYEYKTLSVYRIR